MELKSDIEQELKNRILELEAEIIKLKGQQFYTELSTVNAIPALGEIINTAEKTVGEYFSSMQVDPSKARIEIEGQRYILLRASSLSVDFFKTIQKLYEDHGEKEAFGIGQSFLFDIAHVFGMEDAANFNDKRKLSSFVEKLVAGPVHFAYSGWAYVELLDDSNPVPGEDFFLHYNHPYSFEADSWIKSGKKSEKPVCIMNSGFSSGWCESSAGHPLTAVEISCRACGDEKCSFIMAHPHKIDYYLKKYESKSNRIKHYDIPSFFIRKDVEENIKRAKEKAEASDQAKSQFLTNISHELRTPLNTILGYSELLKRSKLDNELLEYVSYIDQSSFQLVRIVDDLLDLSKIDAGQLLIETETINLRLFFFQLANDAKILSAEKWEKLNFEFHISDDCPEEILNDKVRLRQILNNLISNAIKFTEAGIIKVSLEKSAGDSLTFSVIDHGIGIEKDKFEDIFETFKQADGAFSRKFGGSGLGLSISKKLIELMGGKIWLKSEAKVGTSFYFSLPINNNNAIQRQHQNLSNASKSVNALKVLIAEDNAMNRKLLELVLGKAGHKVVSAIDGFDLLKQFNKNKDADIIITDLQMPGLSGIEAVRILRNELLPYIPIPIIALTAHAMQEDKDKALEAGCNAYLTKPIVPALLLEKIYELLKE
jgi:CheY-like chemotaxis protein/nitrogen-specific signal transduction histidine kinase/predicted hydrocarbon binding protein